jgi:hypothetical protein
MRTYGWIAGLALVLMAGLASASDQSDSRTYAAGPTIAGAPTADLASLIQRRGLLDPSKLTTWRTYSFGVSAGTYGTTSAGLLIQHIQYQLSEPLTLYMEVGLLHNPLGMAGLSNSGSQQASLVIPAVDLVYRPRENMTVSFHYSQMPSSVQRYGYGFGTPWWSNPQAGGW